MTTTPFTFIDTIMWSKENIMSEENKAQYVPFIINRHLSYFPELVLFANDMNLAAHLDKESQYQYFLSSIPKRKRFAKWERKEKNDIGELISQLFQCNINRALEIQEILTPDQISELKEHYVPENTGTNNKNIRRSRAKKSGRLSKSKGNP